MKGSVWPSPPAAVMRPQTAPRIIGWPRPLIAPSSESASAKPMLIPAPTEEARPTRKASLLLCVAKAAAKSGASVDTEPSIRPARPGWTTCSTNILLWLSSSIARAPEATCSESILSASASWPASTSARSPSSLRVAASSVLVAATS